MTREEQIAELQRQNDESRERAEERRRQREGDPYAMQDFLAAAMVTTYATLCGRLKLNPRIIQGSGNCRYESIVSKCILSHTQEAQMRWLPLHRC